MPPPLPHPFRNESFGAAFFCLTSGNFVSKSCRILDPKVDRERLHFQPTFTNGLLQPMQGLLVCFLQKHMAIGARSANHVAKLDSIRFGYIWNLDTIQNSWWIKQLSCRIHVFKGVISLVRNCWGCLVVLLVNLTTHLIEETSNYVKQRTESPVQIHPPTYSIPKTT